MTNIYIYGKTKLSILQGDIIENKFAEDKTKHVYIAMG
jgi:hypothetical protein